MTDKTPDGWMTKQQRLEAIVGDAPSHRISSQVLLAVLSALESGFFVQSSDGDEYNNNETIAASKALEAEIENASRSQSTWVYEEAAVFEAFYRSGIPRTAAIPNDEPDQIIPMVDAMATEINRLRLTDNERTVAKSLIAALYSTDYEQEYVMLRGLLERHFPAPETGEKQETTPEPHSNQSEVSVRPECATSPPWLSRPYWVDPPSGHRYGFPRLYNPATDGDMTAWLVANGYPQHLADKNLTCTFTADAQ